MRTIRLSVRFIPIFLFSAINPARGGEQGLQVFAMRDGTPVSDFQLEVQILKAPSIQPPMVAMASTAGQVASSPGWTSNRVQTNADDELQDREDPSYHFYFGAGASYWQPYRFSDDARSEMVMPEFSVSVAPFGRFVEIGADLAVGDDRSILLRPNLKFYSFETRYVSLYLEAQGALYKCDTGTFWGAGAGAGLMIGIMKHISLEIRGTAVVFNLSETASNDLFGRASDKIPLIKELSGLVVMPSVGARTVARF